MNNDILAALDATFSRDDRKRVAAISELAPHVTDGAVRERLVELLRSSFAGDVETSATVLLEQGGVDGLGAVLAAAADQDSELTRVPFHRAMAVVRATTAATFYGDAVTYARELDRPEIYRVVESQLTEWSGTGNRAVRIVGAAPVVPGERPIDELLSNTFDPDPLVQWAAMDQLGDFGPDPLVVARLSELLDADVIETGVLAAEILLRRAGIRGLEAVMDELVRRKDDGQIDYLWFKMSEVQATQLNDLYRDAFRYAQRVASDDMQSVVGLLIEAWNSMQNRHETMVRPDGTRYVDWTTL